MTAARKHDTAPAWRATTTSTQCPAFARFMGAALAPLAPEDDTAQLAQAIGVLGAALESVDQIHRDVFGAGLNFLIRKPEQRESVSRHICALFGAARREK